MKAEFKVVSQEHDSTPYDDGVLHTRAGAWHNIQLLRAKIVPGWNAPIWVRVFHKGIIVYTGDLRDLRG